LLGVSNLHLSVGEKLAYAAPAPNVAQWESCQAMCRAGFQTFWAPGFAAPVQIEQPVKTRLMLRFYFGWHALMRIEDVLDAISSDLCTISTTRL
jgi:hypothetical protein